MDTTRFPLGTERLARTLRTAGRVARLVAGLVAWLVAGTSTAAPTPADAKALAFCLAPPPPQTVSTATPAAGFDPELPARYDDGKGTRTRCLTAPLASRAERLTVTVALGDGATVRPRSDIGTRQSAVALESPRLVSTLSGTRTLEAWEEDLEQAVIRSRAIALPPVAGWTRLPDGSARYATRFRRENRSHCPMVPGNRRCTSEVLQLTEWRRDRGGDTLVHSEWINGVASERVRWRLKR